MTGEGTGRLVAWVGSYGSPGGITTLDVAGDGSRLVATGHVDRPQEAGYLVYAPSWGRLYAVDERKTDGRGPVGPPASVHAFAVDPADGALTWLNAQVAPGPFPTYLALDEPRRGLLTANHGSFEHVERVVRGPKGEWTVEYVHDDSTVLLYDLEPDGRVGRVRDAAVLSGHGRDPNGSPQAGGHGQSSAHAHCVVLDPSGRYVLVGDKGTDEIHAFALGDGLSPASTYRLEEETGPRHIAFDPVTGRAYVTLEFSSELASFDFDAASGKLELRDRVSTLARPRPGNEPADVRVHPRGELVYVNNRGEDSLAWFRAAADGTLTRLGHVDLATSVHPGLAARSVAFDPSGSFVLVADRPADLVRAYAVDPDGGLRPVGEVSVPEPAFVAVAALS